MSSRMVWVVRGKGVFSFVGKEFACIYFNKLTLSPISCISKYNTLIILRGDTES